METHDPTLFNTCEHPLFPLHASQMAFFPSPPSLEPPPPSSSPTNKFTLLFFSSSIFFLLPHFLPHPPPLSSHHRSLLLSQPQQQPSSHCSSILQSPPSQRCSFSLSHCNESLFNYTSLHFCYFHQHPFLTIPIFLFITLFQFYFLVKTAQNHFSVIVTRLASLLHLSPSMGGVTLLALGNGAPDVFASIAAVRGGHARTGLGAILSAGIFVSAFVVGFVAIYAAPFAVDPFPFVRDVFFYLIAASSLFYVYLTGQVFLWQGVGFVGFYVLFVGFVFWMDGVVERDGEEEIEMGLGGNHKKVGGRSAVRDRGEYSVVVSNGDGLGHVESERSDQKFSDVLGKITSVLEVPVSTLLKLTIPSPTPSEWSRFYLSANIVFCPLALLYSLSSFIPFNLPIVFLLPNIHFPLWSIVLFTSFCLGLSHYFLEKTPSKNEPKLTIITGFFMSVFWISTVAGELLNCLAAVGIILELPPALLGMTVLAWGNSVGDLVADVAVARAGQPAMAMAGCFAGPMFNMLIGLGGALVIQTADVFPASFELRFHVSIVLAFVFLFMSLMGSLLVVTWHRFQVPRFWGFSLVGLYVFFIVISLFIAKVSG